MEPGTLQDAIFNSANFSSIATDAQGVIQIFNVGAERMLGYAAADVVNKITPAEISDPREVIARAEALTAELETPISPGFEALVFKASRGIEDIYELTYIRKDGSRFPAVVSVTALRDAKNTIIGYLLIGTDNTARKRAEAALNKAGALQNAIFNSANFSSIATDAKGVIQIFNVGAERMLGYAAADVMNKITPADISDPQELIARAKALSAELKTSITPGFEALVFKASRGIEDIYELTYIRKDGSRFPAVVSVTALHDDDDAIIGYLLIGTDNTARQHAEVERNRLRTQTQLAQSQKMESVGRLAGGVAHDFNNLLTAIGGFSQFLLDSIPVTDKRRDDVVQIKKAAEKAASLTRQLLTFSRQQVLQMKVLDCNALLGDLEKMLKRIIGEDVNLVTTLAPALGLIRADPSQIEQVVLNLVINARDAMPKGGKIALETSNIELTDDFARTHSELKTGPYVLISVSDTGSGMDAKTLSHLFEPFFTTKEQGKGTGLGLATVYGIVKQSGGGVFVHSEPGHGAVFEIYLPRLDGAIQPVGPSPVPRESFAGSETVLLVEDDELVRKFAKRALIENGYTVLVAEDPGGAVRLCVEHKGPIHLILTDVVMPQMHGPDLVKRLFRLHPESKAIYMSGYTDTSVAHHDLVDSGVPFLQKPLELEVLARKLREVLDLRR